MLWHSSRCSTAPLERLRLLRLSDSSPRLRPLLVSDSHLVALVALVSEEALVLVQGRGPVLEHGEVGGGGPHEEEVLLAAQEVVPHLHAGKGKGESSRNVVWKKFKVWKKMEDIRTSASEEVRLFSARSRWCHTHTRACIHMHTVEPPGSTWKSCGATGCQHGGRAHLLE